jgi:hypothetical protein
VDGVWAKGEVFTFTIRSLTNDDLFYYLGAFSRNEAEDWVQQLTTAVVLLLLETNPRK